MICLSTNKDDRVVEKEEIERDVASKIWIQRRIHEEQQQGWVRFFSERTYLFRHPVRKLHVFGPAHWNIGCRESEKKCTCQRIFRRRNRVWFGPKGQATTEDTKERERARQDDERTMSILFLSISIIRRRRKKSWLI